MAAASQKDMITLGNAAARVIGALGGFGTGAALRAEDYVRERHIRMADVSCCWPRCFSPDPPSRDVVTARMDC